MPDPHAVHLLKLTETYGTWVLSQLQIRPQLQMTRPR